MLNNIKLSIYLYDKLNMDFSKNNSSFLYEIYLSIQESYFEIIKRHLLLNV